MRGLKTSAEFLPGHCSGSVTPAHPRVPSRDTEFQGSLRCLYAHHSLPSPGRLPQSKNPDSLLCHDLLNRRKREEEGGYILCPLPTPKGSLSVYYVQGAVPDSEIQPRVSSRLLEKLHADDTGTVNRQVQACG